MLKLIDKGQMLAQCNIASLPDAAPGKTIGMEEFQDNVRKALGKNLQSLVEAGRGPSRAGYQLAHVVAEGVVEDVPIRWLYYLVPINMAARWSSFSPSRAGSFHVSRAPPKPSWPPSAWPSPSPPR